MIIGRYEAEVTLKMDEEQKSTKLAEPRPVHYNKKVYVGGADNLLKFQGVRSKLNFVGCLQQVGLSSNMIPSCSDIAKGLYNTTFPKIGKL